MILDKSIETIVEDSGNSNESKDENIESEFDLS